MSNKTDGAANISSITITYDAINPPGLNKLPLKVKEALPILYERAQRGDKLVIQELEALWSQYPKVPNFSNYLSVAYDRSGQRDKTEALLEESYRRYPNYLFARTNYALICLTRHQDPKKAFKILGGVHDLKALYPRRNMFHITEVLSFYSTLALYYHAIGKKEASWRWYEILKELDPDHHLVKQLKRKIKPSLMQRLLKPLIKWAQNKAAEDKS